MELVTSLPLPAGRAQTEHVVRRVERFLLDAGIGQRRLADTLGTMRERLGRAQAAADGDAAVRVTVIRGEPLVTIVYPIAAR